MPALESPVGDASSGAATASLPRAWRIAAGCSVVVAYCIPLIMIAAFAPMWYNMPSWDQWHLVPIWEAYFRGDSSFWPQMFQPYAGHLNIVPRFVFLGLALLSNWDIRWELASSFILAIGTLSILIRAAFLTDRRLLVFAAPISAQVFSGLQFENFMSAYPLGQNLSQFAATAAVYFATKPVRRSADFVWAGVGAFIATFSWGAGLVAWPVVIIAILFAWPIRFRALTGILLATVIVSYTVLRGTSGRPPLSLQKIAEFFAVLLGKSVMLVPFPEAAACIVTGTVLFVVAFAVFLWIWKSGPFTITWRWGSFALLAVASGALISIGRFEDGGPQALSSHYVTAVYPLIVAALVGLGGMFLFLHDRAESRSGRIAALTGITAIGLLVFGQPAIATTRTVSVLQAWSGSSAGFIQKLVTGTATDDEIRQMAHPDVKLVRKSVEVLHRYHLAVFKDRSIPAPLAFIEGAAPFSNTPAKPDPKSPYNCSWEEINVPAEAEPGAKLQVVLEVKNTSAVPWPSRGSDKAPRANGDFAVRFGYRWLHARGPDAAYDHHRADLPKPVGAGESARVTLELTAPAKPGDYVLQVGLVHERVAWFEDKGAPVAKAPVSVKKSVPKPPSEIVSPSPASSP